MTTRSRRPPEFEFVTWDDSAQAYHPPTPGTSLSRWAGPYHPNPQQVTANAEWLRQVTSLNPVELSGCVVWLEPSDLTGTADAAVTSWPARVGPTPTTSSGPLLRTSGGPGTTASQAVEFSGSEVLDWPSDLQATPWYELTIVVVAQSDTNTGEKVLISNDEGGFNGDLLFGINQNTQFATRMGVRMHSLGGGNLLNYVADPSALDTAWHRFAFRFRRDESLMEYWEDAVLLDDTPTGSAVAAGGPFYVGRSALSWELGQNPGFAGRGWDGSVAEVIIFNRLLSLGEFHSLDLYLTDKYAGEW